MRYTTYIALAMALAASALARPDGVGGHHGDHGAGHHVEHAGAAPSAPASSYGAPSTGYEQPAYEQSYEQPAYEQPAYDTPSTGYEQSYEPSYDEPASGYGTEVAEPFDPSMLIIPVLIIAGLALLFPQVVCVATNPNDPAVCNRRRKREAGDDSPANLLERVQDIYLAVVESEECMERVACEVGGIAADAGLNMGMTKMAESYVPKKYQKMMKNFNSAKDCHKIKCGAF